MPNLEPRYRLRIGPEIVGFMRKVNGNMTVYSRDGMWWTGNKITHKEVDEWTGLRDKNDQYVFEWDILNYKLDPDGEKLQGVILWEETEQEFGICDIRETSFIPLEVGGVQMFQGKELEVFSYLFKNPGLQDRLGATDE